MDQGSYFALAAALTILGAIWTWLAFRRRGLGPAARALGWTLLAPAAYLTGLLRASGRIADAIVDWATRLVFSPAVWVGFGVAALAVVLIFVSRLLPAKERPGRAARKSAAAGPTGPTAVAAPKAANDPLADDDDLADVNDILKKYGIS